nr:transcription termination factor Rho [Ornithinicoccus halotolerans]
MRLAELQQLAGSMGIQVTPRMRKADLVAAIRDRRAERNGNAASAGRPDAAAASSDTEQAPGSSAAERGEREQAPRQQSTEPEQRQQLFTDGSGGDQAGRTRNGRESREAPETGEGQRRAGRGEQDRADRQDDRREQRQGDSQQRQGDSQQRQGDAQQRDGDSQQRQGDSQQRDGGGDQGGPPRDGDDRRGGRRRNRQRGRDRKRGRSRGGETFTEDQESYNPEDVLVPVAGVLDVLDNYAFIRTTGYLPGPNDVYVPMGMVRKNGLRKGDAVTGAVKAPKDGDQQGGGGNRQKFNALVRLDSVNGLTVEQARQRPDFSKLTPLYPQERLRLETEQKNLTNRVIDIVAPIGKGQRGLLVAPAKAGKTLILQSLANAITTNNPECHLMVVLVDERPEEVTDMERAVQGEVISSTFDRPADDHTTVAELAIERAKRLVEMGGDVVVLLDSITRLGRAYNLAAPASGRILSGGVDSAALYPPKRFFGAARNIENGGSLTILATALVETGSKMDEVIFEEFKGTGNMELKLDRQLANRRVYPAVDINSSGTRREEILMSSEELKIHWKLRRVMSALDQQQAIELLLDRLRKTRNNYEFLSQVQQTSSIRLDDED